MYVNDLNKCIKDSTAYYFADDTNILQSNASLKDLVKKMNPDLKKLSQWMKAKKLSFNVGKAKLIIFRSCSKLISTGSVKYLGVLPDEHLHWTKQLNHIKTRLNQAIGMLMHTYIFL